MPVIKPDGKVRLCVDYRRLNSITPQRHHVIPTVSDILERAGKARVMSKLDLAKGFYQLAMEEESKDLTTFVSPFGRFRFCRMPFGLKNSPAVFQDCIERILRDCTDNASNYIDDILIFSVDFASHLVHVEEVLCALSRAGLTTKPTKCSWGKAKLEYLGHLIGGGEVAVPQHRVTDMLKFKRPVTQTQLRSFLGSMGFYRKFIPKFATLSSVLSCYFQIGAQKCALDA